MWCEDHFIEWLEGRCPKIKSAMTISGYQQIIRECKYAEEHGPVPMTQTFTPATSVNNAPPAIEKLAELQLENYTLRQENHSLRELVKLFRAQIDSFLIAFQATVDGVH